MFECLGQHITYDLFPNSVLLKSNPTVLDPQVLQFSLVLVVLGTPLRLERIRVLILLLLEIDQTIIKIGDFLSLQRCMFVTFETILHTNTPYQRLSLLDGLLVPLQ